MQLHLLQLLLAPPDSTNSTYSSCGIIKYGVLHDSELAPLFFLIYNNDLPTTINSKSEPILFADDKKLFHM